MSVHVESSGRGPSLVLLHGWAMHSGLFSPLVPRLVGRYRVRSVDLPGHGRSGVMTPYTLEAIAAAVAAAVERLPDAGSEPALLLGWSLGGAVALQWAASAPDHVRGLLLVGTSPCFIRRSGWPHAMEASTLRQFGDELATSYSLTLQRFVTLQLQGSEHAGVVAAQLRSQLFARGEPSRDALSAALDLLESIDLRGRLDAVRQRAVVVAGERDTLTPPAAGEWLSRNLPHASFRLIPGAGHAPFLSHPEPFLAALAELDDGA
jgi:pimeloyl-[acyl-carrier protein] methyl ester esterase